MTKQQSQYVCQECGRTSVRHLGRCPSCGGWNTMLEELIAVTPTGNKPRYSSTGSKPQKISEISGDVEERWAVSITEFARVLGGGIVPGSIVLIGGDPGVGKSTLMLQVAKEIASRSIVLYASGE